MSSPDNTPLPSGSGAQYLPPDKQLPGALSVKLFSLQDRQNHM
jgi:hypothetical protein